nr:hypothetical protein [Tanacetum cinerariifolium]
MNNKKRIVNLEYFREMLHICPRIPNKAFDELLFKEEIIALRYLGHNGEIKKITDVNINKLHQPWRSFAAVIYKCLSGKSTGYDNFVYQVEHKDAKKSNEMYYPRFTKVIINFFMTKDPSIPKRNKVNWHYVRDDQMFTTIKLVSRHLNTQQFDAILHVELTNKDIKNSAAYKGYYAIASGAAPPKTKASFRKTHSSFDTTITPPIAAGTRLSTSAKGKQHVKSSKAKDEGTGILPEVPDVPTNESDEEISWKSSDEDDDDEVDDRSDDEFHDDQDLDNDGDDLVHPKLSTHDEEAKDEESFDPIVQTPSREEKSDDEGNDDVSLGMNVGGDEGPDVEDDDNELYGDLNINLEGRGVQMTDVHTTQVFEDTHVTLTPVNPDGQQQSSSVASQFILNMLNPSPDAGIDSLFESIPRVDVQVPTTVAPLPLTAPTLPLPSIPTISQFARSVSFIPGIVDRYIDHRMNEAEQVKVQVSKILPKIEKTVNEQLEAKVLTRSSTLSKTSYVAADLSELELKKILIEKMESNKSIHQSDEQRNHYKALVDAYERDKIILDTYGDTVTLKRRRDDADKDEEPSAGLDQGSKRRREGKERESTSAPKEMASKTTDKYTKGSKSHQKTASKSAPAEEPMQTTQDLEEPSHQEFEKGVADDQPIAKASQHPEWFQKQTKPPTPDCTWNKTLPGTYRSIQPWISDLAKQANSRTSFNELMNTPVDFLAFLMNRLKVDTLIPKLLVGPTYELVKGSCKSLVELEFFLEEVYKATTDQLDWNNPKRQQNPHNLLKPLPLIPNSRGRRVIPFNHFINNDLEYLRGEMMTSSINSRKNVHKKHHHPKACGRSSIKCQKLPKKLNLTKQDTYRSDLKRKEAYTAYSNPRGFIYQNKDKHNRLMRIDELHKFSDDTLNDVRTALDDRLKGIRIKYLPQTIWRRSDKERAAAMIQTIDKQLKTRRIMQSLKKFVGGRLYEGDFRMIQQNI